MKINMIFSLLLVGLVAVATMPSNQENATALNRIRQIHASGELIPIEEAIQ